MIRVTFLGTAAARPTVGRNVSALMVQREGDQWLFDCGEGTQRQMMRYGTGFGIRGIFITHLHADHFLGIIGLLRTLALQDRTEPLSIWGPSGSSPILHSAIYLGQGRLPYPVEILELEAGDRVCQEEYDVVALPVRHGTPAVGYMLEEHLRPGRFDVDRARALGVPEGPLFGKLHRGETVEGKAGPVRPEDVVGPARPGRTVVYSGDTRPCSGIREAAVGTELLVHDATFADEELDRARFTHHSTAREAAEIARKAGARRLALTHISARYSQNPTPLEEEARTVFPDAMVARDGLVFEIGYPQEDSEE